MDEGAVREYVQQSQSIIDSSPQMDEENTKAKLIQPFVELLGWDIYSSEVELEYPVQMGSRHSKVDYALLIGDAPVVFIEVKSCGSDISDRDIGQLRSYMRQELAVDWGVITNGKRFEILTKDDTDGGEGEISLIEFGLERLEDDPELIELLTREAITSGKSDEIVDQISRTRAAIGRLERDRERVADEFSDLIGGAIGDSTPIDVDAKATEFVDDLISTLREQRRTIGSLSEGRTGDTESDGPAGTPTPSFDESTSGRYVVEITDDDGVVERFGDDSQSDVMADVVDYLIRERGLIPEIEPLPYVPGRKKAIINDRPTYPGGDEKMRQYRELIDGYYLDTHMNKRGKKRELGRLVAACGLGIDYGGDW